MSEPNLQGLKASMDAATAKPNGTCPTCDQPMQLDRAKRRWWCGACAAHHTASAEQAKQELAQDAWRSQAVCAYCEVSAAAENGQVPAGWEIVGDYQLACSFCVGRQ